jgi:hypothetical protein
VSTGIEARDVADAGRDSPLRRARNAVSEARPATILFAVAAAASAGVLLMLGSRLIFFLDDWDVLINRRGFSADAFLRPHGENIAVGPVIVYKTLQATLGMDSALPFRIVSVGTFIGSVCLLFVYLRRRVGEWAALAGAVLVLFLGAAWEDLLWDFQVGYFGSMSAGLGALLLLDRADRRGDAFAAALLTVAVLFSSLGLPFLAAAAVAIWVGARDDWPRRWFVVAVPGAVFALWWIGWGHEAETSITITNIVTAPLFLVDGVSAAISSLLGLATPRDESAVSALDWGRPLLVVGLFLAGWRVWRVRRVEPWLLVVLALAAAFWLLAGINEKPGRDPLVSRYVYIGGIFILLVAAELYRGERLGGRWLAVALAVTGLAVASNLSYLDQAYKVYKGISDTERADLAALELSRDTVESGFILTERIAHTAYVGVLAEPYLSAVDAFGSPAYSEDELAAASEDARSAADSVFAAALRLRVDPVEAPIEGAGPPPQVADAAPAPAVGTSCLRLPPGAPGESRAVTLPPGGVAVEAEGKADLRLRRFADEFAIGAGTLESGEAEEIRIPADRSTRPWQLGVTSRADVLVCGLGEG